jgi:hypothetical protein
MPGDPRRPATSCHALQRLSFSTPPPRSCASRRHGKKKGARGEGRRVFRHVGSGVAARWASRLSDPAARPRRRQGHGHQNLTPRPLVRGERLFPFGEGCFRPGPRWRGAKKPPPFERVSRPSRARAPDRSRLRLPRAWSLMRGLVSLSQERIGNTSPEAAHSRPRSRRVRAE